MKKNIALWILAGSSLFAAVDTYWLNPTSADWTDPAAWQGAVMPTLADNVYFRNQADSTVTATQNMSIYRGYVNGKGTLTFDFDPGVVLFSSNHFAISQNTGATGGKTLHIKSGILDLNTNKVFYIGDGTFLGTNTLILSTPNSTIRNGTLQAPTHSCNNTTIVSNGASLVNINLVIGNNQNASNNLFTASNAILTNMIVTVGASGPRNTLVLDNTSVWMQGGNNFIIGNTISSTGSVAVIQNSFVTNVYQFQAGFKGQKNAAIISNAQLFVDYTFKAGADSDAIATGSSDNSIDILGGSFVYVANSIWLGDNVRGDSNGRNTLRVRDPGTRLVSISGINIGAKCSDNRLDVSDAVVQCPSGGLTVGYGNLSGTDLYGCNRNSFTATNSTLDLGTILTVGGAVFTGAAASDSLADIASNSVVNTRGSSTSFNNRNTGLAIGQSVRATNSTLRLSSGSVLTNAYGIMVGYEGFRSRLVVDNSVLVANGGQSIMGEQLTSSENSFLLLNGAKFINPSISRFYVGVNGPKNTFALTNAIYSGFAIGVGSGQSSSNNTILAKDSQLSATQLIFGDWGQKNLFSLNNSQMIISGDVTVGYQTVATQNVIRLSGRNPLLKADSLNIKNGAILEFEVPKEGYSAVPIQCTASGGSSNLTFQADNVWLKVSGKEFQQSGGGWVVLATNLNKTMSGSINPVNCDLPEGSILVNSSNYIAVRLISTGGTILRLY